MVATSTASFGAGFAIVEQSVSGLGTAFAGGAAGAADTSTVFFNPAGMTQLSGTQTSAALHAIKTSFKFKNEGSTHLLQPVTGEGLTGENGGDAGTLGLVPNLYVVHNSGNGLVYGLGVGAPFGLVTDYEDGWVGRYHALTSGIMTINVNPSVAYKVGNLSMGGGVNAMYMAGTFSQAIDYGTATVVAGGIPQREDGEAEITADSWGFGFNVGLLYEFTPQTRIGATYRSAVKQELEGDAEFTALAKTRAILAGIGSNAADDTGVSSDVTLPDTFSIGLFHRFSPQFSVVADALWTNWSEVNELRMVFDNGAADAVTTLDWEDTWRYAVGATYSPSASLDLRCGFAYDQTPIPSAEKRTPRLPDNDRYWMTLGAGYRYSDFLSFDAGYAHIIAKDAKIDKDASGEDAMRGGLKGSVEVGADIFSVQVSMKW